MVYPISSPVSTIDDDDSTIFDENRNLLKNSWQSLAYYKKPISRFRPLNLWMTVLSIFHLAFTLSLLSGAFSSHQAKDVSTFSAHFVRNYGFASLDHDYDRVWEELVPTGHFVCSSDGIEENGERYGKLSMFHQLSCLRTIRSTLQNAHEGKEIGIDQYDEWAWPHCIDYLVQTILCHADDTLELPALHHGTRKGHVSGYQEFRQCRTVQPLYDSVNAMREGAMSGRCDGVTG